MNTVPFQLIQKYAVHIRILNNFKRPTGTTFHADTSGSTSYIGAITNLIEYSGNDAITLDILMRNQDLRRLTVDSFGFNARSYLSMFSNVQLYSGFHCLETLKFARNCLDPSAIRDILRPISSTLVKLHTYDDGFLRGRKDAGGDGGDGGDNDDDELVLPKLRELRIGLARALGTVKNLPKVCPNLEKLDNHNLNGWFFDPLVYIEHDDLEEIFRSQSCPKLNKLNITRNLKNDRLLINLLNSHPGLNDLGLEISAGSTECELAVTRHAETAYMGNELSFQHIKVLWSIDFSTSWSLGRTDRGIIRKETLEEPRLFGRSFN
ncbi:hypothetical protein BGX21_009800 [Mortierella sp. AD011]|nr:hypothetical protein BGX21_009800 [Mortierella sp. AD011]